MKNNLQLILILFTIIAFITLAKQFFYGNNNATTIVKVAEHIIEPVQKNETTPLLTPDQLWEQQAKSLLINNKVKVNNTVDSQELPKVPEVPKISGDVFIDADADADRIVYTIKKSSSISSYSGVEDPIIYDDEEILDANYGVALATDNHITVDNTLNLSNTVPSEFPIENLGWDHVTLEELPKNFSIKPSSSTTLNIKYEGPIFNIDETVFAAASSNEDEQIVPNLNSTIFINDVPPEIPDDFEYINELPIILINN